MSAPTWFALGAGQSKKCWWKEVSVRPIAGGFEIWLDARQLRSPAKADFVLPTRAMAEAVAHEFRAQVSPIDPNTMPVTRAAHAAIDKVTPRKAEVVAELAGYGGADVLCYRAGAPERLRARQDAMWQPWLKWVAERFSAPLAVYTGVIHGVQERSSLDRLTKVVEGFDAFELTALHDLVAISGSLVLGLAVADGQLSANDAFDISRLDEVWQAELWGFDEDAEAVVALKRQSYLNAERFLAFARARPAVA